MSLSTNELKKGGVYTVWWVIFNNPGECATVPCSGADLGVGAVDGAVLWAAGAIADQHGYANFNGHLDEGPAPDGMDIFGSLVNPMTAEVHFVVRRHPEAEDGQVGIGMGTFMGDCGDGSDCDDEFASIHLPPP